MTAHQKHTDIIGVPVRLFDNKSSDTIELLTIAGVAGLLKVSATSVRRLQQKRRLPFIKVGGTVRFAMSDIVAYLQAQRVGSIDQ